MKKLTLAVIATFLCFYANTKAQTKSFEVLNPKVEQGGVLIIRIASQWQSPAVFNPAISVFGKHYLPNKHGEVFVGIGIDVKHQRRVVTLVEYGRGIRLGSDWKVIEIIQKNFTTRTRIPFVPAKKWKQERVVIAKAFDSGDYFEKYFDRNFISPIDKVAVNQGRMIGSESSPFGGGHNGVDLVTLDPSRKKHNRSVRAINSGKVALIAKNYSTEGNMIIIDHGSGIFSIYMHLSRFLVKNVGDMVVGGDVIAMSGNTGNAKKGGPHLHLSIKVRDKSGTSDVYVDPLAFIDTVNSIFNNR